MVTISGAYEVAATNMTGEILGFVPSASKLKSLAPKVQPLFGNRDFVLLPLLSTVQLSAWCENTGSFENTAHPVL